MPDLGGRHQLEHRVDHAQAGAQDRDQPDPVRRAPRRPWSRAASGRRAAASGRRRAPRSRAATRARGRPRGTSWARCARRAGCRACGAPPGAARRGGWARSPRVSSLVGIGGRTARRSERHASRPGSRESVACRAILGGDGRHTRVRDRARAPRAAPRAPARPAPRRRRSSSARCATDGRERVHRGDVVEVDAAGRMLHVIGDPDRLVNLRSAVKPFGLVALLRAPGHEAFDLDRRGARAHGVQPLRRGPPRPDAPGDVPAACRSRPRRCAAASRACPLDALTAARLARDGERPSAVRHMCSGQHSVFLLLAKLNGWPLDGYWHAEHPAQRAVPRGGRRAFGVRPDRLVTGVDGCGILTYAFPLREVARAYAFLADPDRAAGADPRSALAPDLADDPRRDARPPGDGRGLARPARHLADEGAPRPDREQGRDGGAARRRDPARAARGDGSGGDRHRAQDRGRRRRDRATWAATVEALRQVGVLDGQALRSLARYHRPPSLDPHGRSAPRRSRSSSSRPSGSSSGEPLTGG